MSDSREAAMAKAELVLKAMKDEVDGYWPGSGNTAETPYVPADHYADCDPSEPAEEMLAMIETEQPLAAAEWARATARAAFRAMPALRGEK